MTGSYCTAPAEEQIALEEGEREREHEERADWEHGDADAVFISCSAVQI